MAHLQSEASIKIFNPSTYDRSESRVQLPRHENPRKLWTFKNETSWDNFSFPSPQQRRWRRRRRRWIHWSPRRAAAYPECSAPLRRGQIAVSSHCSWGIKAAALLSPNQTPCCSDGRPASAHLTWRVLSLIDTWKQKSPCGRKRINLSLLFLSFLFFNREKNVAFKGESSALSLRSLW